MPVIEVDVSKKQMSRLRNGHSVRVKKPMMKGKGVCLIVDPMRFDTVSRSFAKNKGAQVKLEPREILANYKKMDLPDDAPVEMKGSGIFDDLKKGGKKLLKKVGRETLGVVKDYAGELAGTAAASAATAGLAYFGQPELAPVALPLAYKAGETLGKYGVDKTEQKMRDQIQRNRQPHNRSPAKQKPKQVTLEDQFTLDNTLQGVNKELGTNFGYMGTSGLGNLRANIDSAKRVSEMVNDLYAENDGFGKYESERFGGNGLYAGAGAKMLGEGLYAGSQRQPMRGQGTRVNVRHMKSRPEDANFHFRFTLPPKHQQK